jgi:tetratricopeptide (TPR) repeat protein
MKKGQLVGVLILLGQISSAIFAAQARSSIDGRVTGPDRNPIGNVQVFLLDEGYQFVKMLYTDGSGHFRFLNLRSGTYYLQIEPGATPYERQSQRIEVTPFNERRTGGGELFRVDILLRLRRDARSRPNSSEVVFYQDVPKSAKKEFSRGVKSLEASEFEDGTLSLKRAIEIFPDYYDALEMLGTEYVKRQMYNPALPLLTRAVELNKSGWRGFYSLGIAQYYSNGRSESILSLRRAVALNPDDPNGNMWLGIALSQDPATRVEAIQTLEKVVRKTRDRVPMAYFYLGGLYARNNQYREAADAFEHLLNSGAQIGARDKLKQLIDEYREKARMQQTK